MRLGQVGDQCGRDATSLLAVPALDHAGGVVKVRGLDHDRSDRVVIVRSRDDARTLRLPQCEWDRLAVAPDDVGALKAELAVLEAGGLTPDPLAVRRHERASGPLAALRWEHELDAAASAGDEANSSRTR